MAHQKRWIPLLGLTLIATAMVWLWQWMDYQSMVRGEIEADNRYGDVILASVEGAMSRQCQFQDPDFNLLKGTLEDMRSRVGASMIGIFNPDGTAFVVAKDEGKGVGPLKRASRTFRSLPLYKNCPKTGKVSCGTCPDGRSLEIILEYSSHRLEKRLSRGRIRFFSVGSAFTLAFLCLFLFFGGRLKAVELKAELSASAERVRSLEFLSRLGAGLAHETKNPLGSVRGFAELLLQKKLSEEEVRNAAKRIVDESDRIVARLDEFMLLSRPERLKKEAVDLKAVLQDLVDLVKLEVEAKGGRLSLSGSTPGIQADKDQVRRLFMNLLVNAAEAIGEKGSIDVRIMCSENGCTVEIEDDGPGVPEEIRTTLFEPYVTGKASGTGLGLALTKRIVLEHGWEISYEAGKNGGTKMVVEMEVK